jgi:cob(I)alamin adenosyltransferase
MPKGLVIVFTGEGKGKTSAALGIVVRASGHRMYVSVVQFIKGRLSGEVRALERLKPEAEIVAMGKGFVRHPGDRLPMEEHRSAARAALAAAKHRMLAGSWDVLVLDEINTAAELGLIGVEDILDLIAMKPEKLHLVLTGRGAHADVVAAADMVTEMRKIKHPYDTGRQAEMGIDY